MPSGNSETIVLELPGLTKYLIGARRTVVWCGERAELTTADIEELMMAVNEACTNAINHAFDEQTNPSARKIILRFTPGKGELRVEVEDTGRGFDPDRIMRERKDWTEGEGGLGFDLMKELTDSLKIESAPGSGTKISMVKRASG